jgi:UTP-glucose-1-phosphate uridylyltransferase
LFDADGRLHGWQNIATGEKKPTDLNEEGLDAFAFSGMQLLNPKIFNYMDAFYEMKGPKFSLVDLYIYLCQNHTLKAYVPTNYQMMDVGKINQLEEAERFAQTMLL